MKVQAQTVQEGDFLPGLDNGYVFQDAEENDGYFEYPGGYGNRGAMSEDTVLITFHNSNGDECYLLLPGDTQVEVTRDGPTRDRNWTVTVDTMREQYVYDVEAPDKDAAESKARECAIVDGLGRDEVCTFDVERA